MTWTTPHFAAVGISSMLHSAPASLPVLPQACMRRRLVMFGLAFFWCGVLVSITTPGGVAAAQIPALESNPGAPHTLYLHFEDFIQPPVTVYCPTSNPQVSTVTGIPAGEQSTSILDQLPGSQAEALVQAIWEVVAEDYAPFDVNVTTIEPVSLAPGSSLDPTGRAARVVIGQLANYSGLGYASPSDCNGQPAYTNSQFPNVGFVNLSPNSSLISIAHVIGRRVSHEAGHVYGLRHFVDGYGPITAPIMAYDEVYRYTWYAGVNEEGAWQDDLAQLTALLDQRPDDHSDQLHTATTVTQMEGPAWTATPRVYANGVIERVEDEDMFTFRVSGDGQVRLQLLLGAYVDVEAEQPFTGMGPNLRAEIELWSGDGSKRIAWGLDFTLEALAPGVLAPLSWPGSPKPPPTLQTGSYYRLVVRGQGAYDDLGFYTLIVDGPVADLSGPRLVAIEEPCSEGDTGRIRVTFDQPIAYTPARFRILLNSHPFVHISDPSGPLAITEIRPVPATDPTPTQFDLVFPNNGTLDALTVEIDPQGVMAFGVDPDGQPYWMDQDNDGTNGEQNDGFVKQPSRPLLRYNEPTSCFLREALEQGLLEETVRQTDLQFQH